MFRSIAILELTAVFLGLPSPGTPDPAQLPSPIAISDPSSYSLGSAVRNGRLELVKKLVASGANINATDSVGNTPLMAAVIAGNSEIVAYLLANKSDVNFRLGRSDSTALRYAVLADRADLVRRLVAAGAKVDLRYAEGQTVLHLAASQRRADCLRLLLGADADLEAQNSAGNTPLDEAVLHDRTENVSLLLLAGANVRRIHLSDGRGALQEACVKGYPDLVPLLVAAGADPASPDRWGQTPVDLALAYQNRLVVTALLRFAPRDSKLRTTFAEAMERATERGRIEIVAILLDCGWDVNHPTLAGSTYLNDAALKGQVKTVRLLLDRGARLNVYNQTGGTPLHDASLSGSTEIITLLLDHGCPIDTRDLDSGATPLMVAASLGRIEAVELLLRRGANPALKDNRGRTALNRAQESQDQELVKVLENAGV